MNILDTNYTEAVGVHSDVTSYKELRLHSFLNKYDK